VVSWQNCSEKLGERKKEGEKGKGRKVQRVELTCGRVLKKQRGEAKTRERAKREPCGKLARINFDLIQVEITKKRRADIYQDTDFWKEDRAKTFVFLKVDMEGARHVLKKNKWPCPQTKEKTRKRKLERARRGLASYLVHLEVQFGQERKRPNTNKLNNLKRNTTHRGVPSYIEKKNEMLCKNT